MQHPDRNLDSNLTRNNDDNKHKRMINCGVKNLILNPIYPRPSSTMAKLSEITKPTAFPSQETQFWNTKCLSGIKFPRDSILYAVGVEFEARNSSQHTEVVVGSITFKAKDKIKTCLQKVSGVVEFENADIPWNMKGT